MFDQIKALQRVLKEAGISLENVLELVSGKATPDSIAQMLTPILKKFSPQIGAAVRHLEENHQERIFLMIDLVEDGNGGETEALSSCRLIGDGRFEIIESIPLYMVASYVVNLAKAQHSIPTQPLQIEM